MKKVSNPMERAHAAPRCTATSKRSGLPCKNPAVKGWSVCRMHGARGGHSSGKANPAYKHGMRTRETQQMRKAINEHIRLARALEKLITE
ncbi:HGGxSTG domain-containing protein [Ruegeria sp. ANG10]|uniref:HGGxSTG domain-containing protein n=1 Tax=Ruegeria sp. ANG10 TaxID=3042467 RepID=UPI003453EADE